MPKSGLTREEEAAFFEGYLYYAWQAGVMARIIEPSGRFVYSVIVSKRAFRKYHRTWWAEHMSGIETLRGPRPRFRKGAELAAQGIAFDSWIDPSSHDFSAIE